MKAEEKVANYAVLEKPQKSVGWVRPEAVTHQTETVGYATLTHPTGSVPVAPATWKAVPLGEVLEDIVGGGTPSRTNSAYWEGNIPWLTVKDMRSRRPQDSIDHISEDAVRSSATNLIPADTVIIATRIGLGKVIRVPYDATINQDLKALITKPIVDKGYLEYWIVSIANYLDSIGSGTTVKGIRLEQLRSIPFPLAPLDQQTRIVAEIEKQFSRLDEAVANLKRVKANLKRYKAAVLKAAVEGRLVETEAERARREGRSYETGAQLLQRILETRRSQWQGKGKYKEPAAPDTTSLTELPEGWVWATVEQISGLVEYGSSAKTSEDASGIPVLRMGNIFEGGLRFDDLKYLPNEHDEFPKLLLRPGDLLFNRTNSPELVGKTAVFGGLIQRCSFASYLIRVRLVPGAHPNLFSAVINSSYGRKWVKSVVTQQVGQANVNGTKLQALCVPLPPEAEQNCIVAEIDRHLSLANKAEAQVNANLRRAERLRQSILGKAFVGVSP